MLFAVHFWSDWGPPLRSIGVSTSTNATVVFRGKLLSVCNGTEDVTSIIVIIMLNGIFNLEQLAFVMPKLNISTLLKFTISATE